MRQQQTALTLGDIIQDRYHVESFLGGGGFSSVYLVRDLQPATASNALYALKELCDQDEREKIRFLFEGEVLRRLHHHALPGIHRIFDDEQIHRIFMLLEYIDGPNLETLRREQVERRFPYSAMLTMLGPVVEAISYLHEQQPPIIHRDIKPANIIVPKLGERAVLVDFGIAKEYEADATTTAVRHCTPGYGAPEQYSGQGTDPSTDIYGLAATCYVLLTGTVPADALHRATTLVSKKFDPLVPVNELIPDVSAHVAQTIARAMSIGQEYRFSSVQEFWQELHDTHRTSSEEQQSAPLPITDSLSLPVTVKKALPFLAGQKDESFFSRSKRKLPLPISLLLVLLVCCVIGLSSWLVISNANKETQLRTIAPISATNKAPPPTALPQVPKIAQTYRGTIYDISTDKPTDMALMNIQQDDARISGTFSGLHTKGTFTGVLDQSKHVFFTVTGTVNRSALFFEGSVRADGGLVGNYCSLDAVGQCTGRYGLWSITPAYT